MDGVEGRTIVIKANEVNADGCIYTEECLKDMAEQTGGALVWHPVEKELRNNELLRVAACMSPIKETLTAVDGKCVRLIEKIEMIKLETWEIEDG